MDQIDESQTQQNEAQYAKLSLEARCMDLKTRESLLKQQIEAARIQIKEQQQWIIDLQSGMYVNCAYCGHRYGPTDEVPASMADVLKEHIEQCPRHPMSKLRAELELIKGIKKLMPGLDGEQQRKH